MFRSALAQEEKEPGRRFTLLRQLREKLASMPQRRDRLAVVPSSSGSEATQRGGEVAPAGGVRLRRRGRKASGQCSSRWRPASAPSWAWLFTEPAWLSKELVAASWSRST